MKKDGDWNKRKIWVKARIYKSLNDRRWNLELMEDQEFGEKKCRQGDGVQSKWKIWIDARIQIWTDIRISMNLKKKRSGFEQTEDFD